jgi:hypothetical protein
MGRLCGFVRVRPGTAVIGPPVENRSRVADSRAQQGSDGCSPQRGRDTPSLIRIGGASGNRSQAEADKCPCDGMAGASRPPHAWISGRRIARTSRKSRSGSPAWDLSQRAVVGFARGIREYILAPCSDHAVHCAPVAGWRGGLSGCQWSSQQQWQQNASDSQVFHERRVSLVASLRSDV